MADQIRREIKIDAKSSLTDLGKLSDVVLDVNDSLDDGQTKGKKFADALSQAADDIKAGAEQMNEELRRTADVADVLAQALGPDLAAKADTTDIVMEFQRLGLSLDDIEQEADELAAAIRKIDDAGDSVSKIKQPLADVDAGMRKVGETTDNTRSVVANFAGNAVQEIPGISGAMGPLNMAIGQFGEYAAEGNIKLSSFVKAAGGLAVATIAVKGIADHFAAVAETKAFHTDRVDAFTDALEDAESQAEAIKTVLTEAGKVEFRFGDIATIDVTAGLAALGVDVETFSNLVASSDERLEEWAVAMHAAGMSGSETDAVLAIVRDHQDDLATATERSAVNAEFFGTAVDGATESTGGLATSTASLAESLDEARQATVAHMDAAREEAEALDGLGDAAERTEDRIRSLEDAQRSAIDADFALRDATRDAATAIWDYTVIAADGTATEVAKTVALEDATKAALSQADAAVVLAEGQAKANGQTLTASERAAIYAETLGGLAAGLEPGSPLRTNIEGYASDLGTIPGDINTRIDADVEEAAAKLRAILAMLGSIGNQTTKFGIDAGGNRTLGRVGAGATGGIVTRPTLALIGEAGPEAIVPLNQTAGSSPLGAGASTVINLTVNAGLGTNGREVGDVIIGEIRRYERRNGSGWRVA